MNGRAATSSPRVLTRLEQQHEELKGSRPTSKAGWSGRWNISARFSPQISSSLFVPLERRIIRRNKKE